MSVDGGGFRFGSSRKGLNDVTQDAVRRTEQQVTGLRTSAREVFVDRV